MQHDPNDPVDHTFDGLPVNGPNDGGGEGAMTAEPAPKAAPEPEAKAAQGAPENK